MSVLLNFGASLPQAPSSSPRIAAKLKREIVINQQRGEQRREVDDRVAEGLARHLVAVGQVDPQRVGDEDPSQEQGEDEIHRAAYSDDIGQQAGAEENQGIEQNLQARVPL